MKITPYLTTTFVIAVLCSAAWSQTTTRPTTTESFGTLPELKFDNVKLDDALTFLSDVDPTFAPQLVRDPRVPSDYPMITFRAKNITIPQFLEFLQQAYGIGSSRIAGPGGFVYLITVEADSRVEAYLAGQTKSQSASTVNVFNISDVVQRVAALKPAERSSAERAKLALNDVLALVQAALELTPQANKATLKVHEGTESLIFKGTIEQLQVVEDTLKTLRGTSLPGADYQYLSLKQRVETLQNDVQTAAQQAAIDASTIAKLEAELAVRSAQTPTTRP
jgi:hypothetical protein